MGRTSLGKPISRDEFKKTIEIIVNNLKISKEDYILDIGCGNGLITYEISKFSQHITGIDINSQLLKIATENHLTSNINYSQDDIIDIDFTQYKASKFYMYGVLQSIEYKYLRLFLQNISKAKKTFKLFIADIPDQEKILNFYHTEEGKRFLFHDLIENRKIHLGNWWYKEHIINICKDLGLKVLIKEQDSSLYSSYYRFDALIEKI